MCRNPIICGQPTCHLGLLFVFLLSSTALSQTVGDTFIDTSEWVQSTSPIRDGGRVEGHITETIVRGYRGPSYDRYYGGGNYNSAIEFSNTPKIQPVVYENSPNGQTTSLEPPLRPTPDPVVQAANNGDMFNRSNNQPVRPATLSNMRGFASQASFQQPLNNQPGLNQAAPNSYPNNSSATPNSVPNQWTQGRWIQTGYVPQTTAPTYPVGNYINTGTYPVRANYPPTYPPQANSQPPTFTQPVPYTAMQNNGCDPVYARTQFVSPNANSGPGALRTYPQYGNNPNARRGFDISQPQTRDTWVPLIRSRSMPYGVYLGQGMIGQPVAYVEREPFRNFLRYIFP